MPTDHEPLTFEHSRSGRIKIGSEAISTMRAFAQHADDAHEAGGLMLGRYIHDGHDLVVDRVTTPKPSDTRSRFAFHREADEHQAEIDAAWKESGGTRVFLGDWHTHAEPDPTPSDIDRDNWRRMLREDIRDNEACFFVIVGQREIRCWEGDRATGEIKRCQRDD